jgi:hypothetical protein
VPGLTAVALVGLLLTHPISAVGLVKVATIPKGQINFYEIPVGDLDHDGRRELVFEQSRDPFSPNIWEQWGSNSYQPAKILDEGCSPAAVGDPDEDGLSDLLCQWGGRAFLLESQTPTTFPTRTVWEESIGGFPGLRGYFQETDHDGRKEMWIVPNDPDWIEVWENRGNDTYERVALLSDPTINPETLAFGDFDGDGTTEAVVGGPSYNDLSVWEATQDDTWALKWRYNEFPLQWTTGIVSGAQDLDGDGKPEFLVGTLVLDTLDYAVTLFEATGDDAYAPIWQIEGPESHSLTHIVVGDVDGDEAEEFVVKVPGALQVYEGVGNDEFARIGEVPYDGGDLAIALADLNENGVDELIFNGVKDRRGRPAQIHIYELADLQPPVLIPALYPGTYEVESGKAVSVHTELHNRTEQPRTVDVWGELYAGSGEGGPQGPLLRRELLASQAVLPADRTVSRKFFVGLPRIPGRYTLQLKVGTFPATVKDTRWFTVTVTQ